MANLRFVGRKLTDADIQKFRMDPEEGDTLGRRFDRFYHDQPPCRKCRSKLDEKLPVASIVLPLTQP
jgi:hypothetical protein